MCSVIGCGWRTERISTGSGAVVDGGGRRGHYRTDTRRFRGAAGLMRAAGRAGDRDGAAGALQGPDRLRL